ncbi:MAG TPA: response regulator transcription factor [Clostridia bacterium]|nr:response regulator transcription factor [Clostridia bacterium]
MKKIMIVEDDKKIRDELSVFLVRNGYQCSAPDKFESILEDIGSERPDLVLLDINLPSVDGFYICRELRKQSELPIIVVTSRDTELDELMAMNFGADDFITKPYNTQILLAHISSVLKRASRDAVSDRLDCGGFTINLSRGTIDYPGGECELTKNELKILTLLYENKGAVVSRDELMTQLWNSDMFVDDNTLTVNINRLRNKLEDAGLGQVIETRRGRGYIIG